jgi:hypothetical protein
LWKPESLIQVPQKPVSFSMVPTAKRFHRTGRQKQKSVRPPNPRVRRRPICYPALLRLSPITSQYRFTPPVVDDFRAINSITLRQLFDSG